MELLLNEINKLLSLDMNKVLADVFSDKDLQKQILDKIRDDQLYEKGVSEENKIIGYYSPYTKNVKIAEGQRYDHITLKDTGYFYNSFVIHVNPTFIIIDADDEKTDEAGNTKYLFEVYNDRGNIVGLTSENMDWLTETLTPLINDRIENILQ